MKIIATQFTLVHQAFEIYVSGCTLHCEGCQNHELWDFDNGEEYTNLMDSIFSKIKEFKGVIKKVILLGGEPFDQDVYSLLDFINQLRRFCNNNELELWLFTGYTKEELFHLACFHEIFANVDFLKCGRYIKSLETNNNIQYAYTLATNNQYIMNKEQIHEYFLKDV